MRHGPGRPAGADNFVKWRRTIDEHLELGRLTWDEYGMFSWLCTKADQRTGRIGPPSPTRPRSVRTTPASSAAASRARATSRSGNTAAGGVAWLRSRSTSSRFSTALTRRSSTRAGEVRPRCRPTCRPNSRPKGQKNPAVHSMGEQERERDLPFGSAPRTALTETGDLIRPAAQSLWDASRPSRPRPGRCGRRWSSSG